MANHAHSTRTPLLRQITASAGLLAASIPSGRIVAAGGPVTRALAVMAEADPDLARIRVLRRSIANRIEADLALLDALDGDPDFEPSLGAGEPYTRGPAHDWSYGGDDREDDAGDNPELENEHGAHDDAGEPSLGSLISVCQLRWGVSNRTDREAGDDNGMADEGGMHEQICRFLDAGGSMQRQLSGVRT